MTDKRGGVVGVGGGVAAAHKIHRYKKIKFISKKIII